MAYAALVTISEKEQAIKFLWKITKKNVLH